MGIVAHEKRRAHAEALADKVGGFVSRDDGTLGCNGNHLEVYRNLAGVHEPWVVVLEDDAIPVEDFNNQLDQALNVAPCPIVSLYLGTSRPIEYQHRIARALDRAARENANWLVGKRLLHAVGVAMPTESIPSLLAFLEEAPHRVAIDEAITHWVAFKKLQVCYTLPSLVDHRDDATLFIHPDGQPRTRPRKAHRFGARTCWDATSVRL